MGTFSIFVEEDTNKCNSKYGENYSNNNAAYLRAFEVGMVLGFGAAGDESSCRCHILSCKPRWKCRERWVLDVYIQDSTTDDEGSSGGEPCQVVGSNILMA